jgi:hypothetical protein
MEFDLNDFKQLAKPLGTYFSRRCTDAHVTGDIPQAVVGITAGARELALEQAWLAYSGGFASALLVAAILAFTSAALVGLRLERLCRPGFGRRCGGFATDAV